MSTPSPKAFLQELGPRWHLDVQAHRDEVFNFYRPFHQTQLARLGPGSSVIETIQYGSHSNNAFEIYWPKVQNNQSLTKRTNLHSVIYFVHGGAFVRGDRNVTAEVYSNVLREFCRSGFIGVNIGYRLAPEASYPDAAIDIVQAITKVTQVLSDRQIGLGQQFLMGHSAGGTHCATAFFDPNVAQHTTALRKELDGLILISPRLKADIDPKNVNAAGVRAYFGADEAMFELRSPLTHMKHAATPVFIGMAEFENPLLHDYVEPCRKLATYRYYKDHNHMSIITQFDSGFNDCWQDLQVFFNKTTTNQA